MLGSGPVTWLEVIFLELPVPADVAVGRAEQLLEATSDDPWAEAATLKSSPLLYAYVSRPGDARAAIARSQSVFAESRARTAQAEGAFLAGQMERIAGDTVAADG